MTKFISKIGQRLQYWKASKTFKYLCKAFIPKTILIKHDWIQLLWIFLFTMRLLVIAPKLLTKRKGKIFRNLVANQIQTSASDLWKQRNRRYFSLDTTLVKCSIFVNSNRFLICFFRIIIELELFWDLLVDLWFLVFHNFLLDIVLRDVPPAEIAKFLGSNSLC